MRHNGNVIRQLILKDWRLHRPVILLTMGACVLALAALFFKRQTPFVLGILCFCIALIFMGALLTASNILNERKKQTLPFVMSLPVTPAQYGTAKLVSTAGMFLIPWLTLAAGAMWLLAGRSFLPHGAIPLEIMLLLLLLAGFSLIMGMTLAGETEGWNMAANIIGNSSYGITWYFITISPSLMQHLDGNAAEWNSARLTFVGCELALIGAILGVTYYIQSQKREFV